MKNKLIAALAVLFALALTACDENNTVQPEQTETATSAVSEETAAVAETEAETVTIAGQEYSTDTSGLELVSVTLDGADLENIAKFKKLESLHLTDVKLDNIDFLYDLPQLKWLYAENTPLPDISPIAALDCPDQINLVNCGITDISGLRAFAERNAPIMRGNTAFTASPFRETPSRIFHPLRAWIYVSLTFAIQRAATTAP